MASPANVLDVQKLINLINNPTANGVALSGSGQPGLHGMSTLSLPDIQLAQGETGTFGVRLTNAVEIAAGQFSFSYDSTSGFDITGVTLTDRTQGFYEPVVFHKDASDPANVKVLVLYFSLSGATITPGSGDILTFSYRTTPEAFGYIGLQLTGSILSDPNGDSSLVEHEIGYVTLEEPKFYTILASAGIRREHHAFR